MKKLFSLILSLMMAAVIFCSPLTAFAADYNLDVDVNLYSNFTSGSTITLQKDITGSDVALVITGKTLTFDLNNHTLRMPSCIIVSSSTITFKNGTICTSTPHNGGVSVITVSNASTLNLDNVKVLAGDAANGAAGDDAITIADTSTATIKDSYLKGGSIATPSKWIEAGSALYLQDSTATATVTNSTLALGEGGNFMQPQSAISVYGQGKVYNGADSSEITAPTFTSDAEKKMLVVGTGSSLAPEESNGGITEVNGSQSADVQGTYVEGEASGTVYSVDVSWGDLSFTYTAGSEGSWNPKSHTYDGETTGAWTCEKDANKITVTNHSNKAVDATLSYTKEAAYSTISGIFTDTSNAAIANNKFQLATAEGLSVAAAPKGEALLNLEGALSEGVNDTKIGMITVTISDSSLDIEEDID